MKPIFSATKSIVETMDFYPTSHHPDALWMTWTLDGKPVREGAVHRRVLSDSPSDGIVEFFKDTSLYVEASRAKSSLPKNAIFWPVPAATLADPAADLLGLAVRAGELRDAPAHVLVYKSPWDHRVYSVDGLPVSVPVRFELWATRFDLQAVERHLKGHPALVSFTIVPNRCRQNYDISGTVLGELILLPHKIDGAPEDPTASWVNYNVLHGFGGPELDLLGVHQFLREKPY